MEETMFVSLTALGQRLGVSRQTVRKIARDGEIPSYRIGLKIMFRETDIEAWLQAQKL